MFWFNNPKVGVVFTGPRYKSLETEKALGELSQGQNQLIGAVAGLAVIATLKIRSLLY